MKRRFLLAFLALSMMLFLVGCGKEQANSSNQTVTISYKDQQYTVPKNPKRIAVLATSLVNMLYAIDGTAIARPVTAEEVPEKAKNIATIGQTANINAEALLSQKPDFVIGLRIQNEKIASILESNKIPFMFITYEGIHDNLPLIEFLGKITGNEKKAAEVSEQYTLKLKKVKAATKDLPPARVAVLRATGKSVTAETEKAITASMVKELGMKNVLLDHKDIKIDATTVPYSLESITQDNPDIIFVVTMGNMEEINKTLAKEMTGNPAWSELKAVKENKVFYLPQKLFLLNPGLQTPEAMAQLIEYAYGVKVEY